MRLEHFPEKWEPIFRKRMRPNMTAGRAHADRGCPAQRAGAIGALLAAAASLAAIPSPAAAHTVCSVFDDRPCAPTTCSVFNGGPCASDLSRVGEELQTVELREPAPRPRVPPAGPANTLRELFDAMSTCWKPPPLDRARPGTQITIRFSLNRAGELLGEPRFTYSTPNLPAETKAAYQHAVATSLTRCAPFSLSDGLAGAIAGRPISIRIIDDIEPRMERPI